MGIPTTGSEKNHMQGEFLGSISDSQQPNDSNTGKPHTTLVMLPSFQGLPKPYYRDCTCLNSPDSEIPHVACSSGSSSGENGSSQSLQQEASCQVSPATNCPSTRLGGTTRHTRRTHTTAALLAPKKSPSINKCVCRNHPCVS